MPLVTVWSTPIKATWTRANILTSLTYSIDGLRLRISEEDSEKRWVIHFKEVQAFRVTTEELSAPIFASFSVHGGFYEVKDSPWIAKLGAGEELFLANARHFIVSCYDEVVEVVAHDAAFHELDSSHGQA